MTDRHLAAYAIVILLLVAAVLLWLRSRRTGRSPEPHLKIDLIHGEGDEPAAKP